MKVRMLKNQQGSLDGVNTIEYLREHIYNVPSEMSEFVMKSFLQRGICEIYNPVKIETKIIQPKETKVDYNKLSFKQLQKKAKNMGINTYKMNKEKIIEAISEVI